MADELLSLDAVTVRLGDRELFCNVSFRVEAQGLAVITGESGVGKSTLLKAIMGDIEFDGSIVVCGKPVDAFSGHDPRAIVLCPQHADLWEHLTALENLLLVRSALFQEGRHAATPYCLELLDSLEVEQIANRYPYRLSGGEQQRVSLARALAANAKVYLFDEPSTHLDRKRIHLVIRAIQFARSGAKAVVVATHDSTLVAGLGVTPFVLGPSGVIYAEE